jgi:predicted nucleotidyltransferase
MVEAAVVNLVQRYLQKLNEQGFDISFGVVFGSYVTGNVTELSDIDIIVVSPDFDREIQCTTVDKIWQLAGRTDSRIEPVPCGLRQWQKGDLPPIYEIARSEGQIINMN